MSVLKNLRSLSEMGLIINLNKTQICKLDKGFIFLKLFHILTSTGKIIRKPSKDSFVRERRKLKKLKEKFNNGKIAYRDIETSYKSWRGNLEKYNCYK